MGEVIATGGSMDGERAKSEGDDLALAVFEGIGSSGASAAGCFLSLDGSRILIPGGALEGAFSGSYFHIDILPSDDSPDLVARVSTGNWALTRDALVDGAGYYETVHFGMIDDAFSVFAEVRTKGKDARRLVSDIIDACLVVDGAVVAAIAHDAGDNPDVAWDELDFKPILEQFGFGATAQAAAKYLNSEYGCPHEQVLAGYSLPYNLQKIAESGVLDAVIAETDGGFGLHKLVWRRWFFCSEIIGSLQARGFTNDQIAYVIRNDEDLFDVPETRDAAESLCRRIEQSGFDPEDIDSWNAYTATETGPLAAFL